MEKNVTMAKCFGVWTDESQ